MMRIRSAGTVFPKRQKLVAWAFALSFSVMSVGGCSPQAQHQALMDNIEKTVLLPMGAAPMARYARAYAKGAGKYVIGLYFIPSAPEPARCERMLAQSAQSMAVAQLCSTPQGLVAGQRRWLDHPGQPVRYEDGGCMQIDVSYDMDRHKVVQVRCQGRG